MRSRCGRRGHEGRPGWHPTAATIRLAGVAALMLVGVSLLASCGRSGGREPAPLAIPEAGAPHVAVLPFYNEGGGDDWFFVAGMTDEISDRLTAVSGLTVISRSSAEAVVNELLDLATIGKELGADHVLVAGVRLDREADGGPRLSVDARLIRVADEAEAWSAAYDRPLADVFEIQADVALNVADALAVQVEGSERRVIEARPTADMAAYESYLRGLPDRWSFERRELQQAGEHFVRATELDPGFALAHAALSEHHSQMFHFRYDRSPQRLASAIAAAHRALEIDPELSEGHRALGYYYYWGQRNYAEALSELSAAAQSRPNDPLIVASIGIVLRRQGRWEEALTALERTAELNPKSDVNLMDLASTCGMMRRYDAALAHCRRAVEMSPYDIFPYVYSANIVRNRDGSLDGAREMLERMPDKDPSEQAYYFFRQSLLERDFATASRTLARTGDLVSDPISEEIFPHNLLECEIRVFAGEPGSGLAPCRAGRQQLERESELSPADPAIQAALGWNYALLGEHDAAVTAGERAVELLPVSADAVAGHSYLVRLAKIYARVGEPYAAVKTIQKALTLPGWLSVATLKVDPAWDPIRDDPKFRELLRIHGAGD